MFESEHSVSPFPRFSKQLSTSRVLPTGLALADRWWKARGTLPESDDAEGDVEEEEEYGSSYSSLKPMLLSMSCKADRFGPGREVSNSQNTDGVEWRKMD